MNEDNKITRRDALKRMGAAVISGAVASSGLLSLASCEGKKNKRIIFYFTGTGNSLHIARQLADEHTELPSIPQMVKCGKYDFEADEIGIVYPIYGHMPPYMVRQFIQKAKLKAGYKFAVLTYGARKCDAVEIWDGISRKAGNAFDYINTIVMVDHMHRGFMQWTKLDPEVGFLMKSEKCFTVTDACIDCGICTYVCPRGNYELTSRGVKMSGDCEFCFACIQNCPQKAIQFRKSEDGSFPDGTEVNPNARYRNEHISLMDLKLANNQKL